MKNKGIILTVILGFTLIFSSCKKGANDPTFSFSSRDARITADWLLESMNSSTVTVDQVGGTAYTSTTKYVFDGTTMKKTSENGFGTQEFSYPYAYELNINPDGIYKVVEEEDGEKSENTNYWFWANSDKKKIAISFSGIGTYMIDRLAKDELVLTHSESTSDTNENGDVSTTDTNLIMTFSKK